MTARLAYALLRIARQIGQQAVIDGRKVEIIGSCITQSVIGSMARCTRSNVNRRLKKWEQCGIIKIRNRSIYVIDRDWLSGLISS
ncbi:helix-turn-helix domain-containing protein [Ruegeria sp. HKCCD8929]|uniref:helix-turn-helix domain-containing protein n=1 Tax=Ruegeria sp. HKCCD8929 TaxID=2683006 RepID=UPI0014898128|nr:helix-turn-helix domain-containing protein [Ruegeria sp. HKCCD8929]